MKTCQNCGNLITEKARFCPRCGALLQNDALYEPLETLHCHPLTASGPKPESAAQTVEARPKKDLRHDLWNRKIWILCVAGLLIVILACSFIGVSAASGGITGSWKETIPRGQATWLLSSDDVWTYSMMGMQQMEVEMDLAEDNTLTINAVMDGGDSTFSGSVVIRGTYEMLSGNVIRLNMDERTVKWAAYGLADDRTRDISETQEWTYSLNGDTLTLVDEDMEMQMQFGRS